MSRKPTSAAPVLDVVAGLRQRQRADGSWRVWWEPNATQKKAGAVAVDLDASKPGHAARQAARLNADAAQRAKGGATKPRANARSISDLINDYTRARGFQRLRATTQGIYRADLKVIEEKWGPQPVALFDRPVVAAWYDALYTAKGVFRSKSIFRMLSILMGHAELLGWRAENSNPCFNVRVETPEGRDRIATWPEIEALLAAARKLKARHVRMAILLGLYAGQRVTDVREARPEDFACVQVIHPGDPKPRPLWIWSLTQSKRRKVVTVPLHAEVIPALRTQRVIATAGPGTLIWDEATGKPFTKERLFHAWERVRAEAAKTLPSVATLQERDLRRTFGNLSRHGGAGDADVADVLGNTAAKNAQLRQVYMAPQLATALRAVSAIEKPKGRKQG